MTRPVTNIQTGHMVMLVSIMLAVTREATGADLETALAIAAIGAFFYLLEGLTGAVEIGREICREVASR